MVFGGCACAYRVTLATCDCQPVQAYFTRTQALFNSAVASFNRSSFPTSCLASSVLAPGLQATCVSGGRAWIWQPKIASTSHRSELCLSAQLTVLR